MRSVVFAGLRGGGECQLAFGGGGVAGAGVVPGSDEQDRAFVEVAAPGVFLAVRVALGAAVGDAGLAQLAEGDRVAAGFGEEVAAVAEHVGPPVQGEQAASGCLPSSQQAEMSRL